MGRKKVVGDELSRDVRGNYQRDIGWEGEPPKYKQHRFYLGKDRAEAAVRSVRLERVWQGVERLWAEEGKAGRVLWDEITLQIGKSVSKGENVCCLELPQWATADDTSNDELVLWVDRLQPFFPVVRIALEEGRQEEGEAYWCKEADEHLDRYKTIMDRRTSSQTLHQALDGFGEYLKERYRDSSGRLSLTGQVSVKEIPLIKAHIPDRPLSALDLSALDHWVDYWSKRPMTKRGKPAAPKTCRNVIKRIRMFVRWLHKSKEWHWRKPEDYEVLPVRIKLNAAELARKASGDQVDTYTDAELVTLYKHAKPKERLLMLLGLNCGFGIAEIASLQLSEIHISQTHRKYKTAGDWIYRIRGKTTVYGEWSLWSTTAEAIRWYQGIRGKSGETALILNEDGSAISEQTSGGNRAQTIPNTWQRLTDRVRKLEDGSFRKLSFNKLRKTATNAIRDIAGGEVAGVFSCHGQPVPTDTLIDLYSNRDFRKVHDACEKWGERLAPMFAGVSEPFVKAKRKHQKPEAIKEKRERIRALREEGKTYKQIGEEVGLSINAVRHHLK